MIIPAWAERLRDLAERARAFGRDESLSREERERAYQHADSLLAANRRYRDGRCVVAVLFDMIDRGYTILGPRLLLSNAEGDSVRLHRSSEADFIRAWLYLEDKPESLTP